MAIYGKYLEADGYLQKINRNAALNSPPGSAEMDFKSAVLAEYRLIRPKLEYPKDAKKREEFSALRELDSFIVENRFKGNSEELIGFIKAHLLVGDFIEVDGISKFESVSRLAGVT